MTSRVAGLNLVIPLSAGPLLLSFIILPSVFVQATTSAAMVVREQLPEWPIDKVKSLLFHHWPLLSK